MSEYHLNEWKSKIQGPYVPNLLAPLEIRPGADCLDLGCGSGYVNVHLAARGVKRNLGMDLFPETMEMARKLNRETPGIGWVCASAEAIPLPDASLDHVICRGVVPLAHVRKVMAEIARVLRPGGTAVLLLHRWDYYLHWFSLRPSQWKRAIAGLMHTAIGAWFNLTGMQVQWRIGGHLFGQTFQTVYRMKRITRPLGMEVYHAPQDKEFLVYVRKGAAKR